MKPDTDKYEQMKKKGNQKNVKIKERKKNDIAMPKEMKRKIENNKDDTEQNEKEKKPKTNKENHTSY